MGQPGALERIPAGQRAWSGPITARWKRLVEGAHFVRAHSASRFFPVLRGPHNPPPDQRQLKGCGGADFDNPLRRVRAGRLSRKPPRRPRSRCALSTPARHLSHSAIGIFRIAVTFLFELTLRLRYHVSLSPSTAAIPPRSQLPSPIPAACGNHSSIQPGTVNVGFSLRRQPTLRTSPPCD